MSTLVKARIVKIGRSRGVRIPNRWLNRHGLRTEVEIAVQPDQIVIRPSRHVRKGWDEHFRAMALRGEDKLLNGIVQSDSLKSNSPRRSRFA